MSIRHLLVCFCWLLSLLVAIHQQTFEAGTPASRLALLQAISVERTLRIDRWQDHILDKARWGDHYYSDKAPGTAALALPFVACTGWIGGHAKVNQESDAFRLLKSCVACGFSQAFPSAFGGVLLSCWLRRFVSERVAWLVVVALWLGSVPLPYCTLLFSHAEVIGLIAIAIWAMDLFADGSAGRGIRGDGGHALSEVGCFRVTRLPLWRMGLAGYCLGLALASEYTAGVVVIALVVHLVIRYWKQGCALQSSLKMGEGERPDDRSESGPLRSWVGYRPLWWFFTAAVPPLLLIPAYSWATIGTPFGLPYSYQASFPQMKEGLYAIKWPDLENLGRLLVGPTRGLVFCTPFLVMAGFGWWWIARERPRWLWLTYAVPVLHALVISGRTWDWQAGYTISARYMAPILPLLVLPCAIGTQRWPKLGTTLAVISIGMMTLATITDACPDYSIYNPLTELHIPKLLRGEFSYTLGTEVFGLNPWVSVVLYYAILISGIAWLWRLAGQADREAQDRALINTAAR